jgi:hypothetical protein
VLNQGTGRRCGEPAAWINSHPAATSQSNTSSDAGGELEDCLEVGRLQLGIVGENFPLVLPRSKPTKNIPYGDAQSPDARLPRPLPWLDCYAVVFHRNLTSNDTAADAEFDVILLGNFRREQVRDGFAAPDETRLGTSDEHFRWTQTGVVVGALGHAVGAGIEQGHQIAGLERC